MPTQVVAIAAQPAGLDFVQGDAQNLHFPDQSFDAVINVEASHIYPNFERFLGEVARVLRPEGISYTPISDRDGFPAWKAALAEPPMRLVSERIINDQVLRGLHENSPRSTELIDRYPPTFARRFGREFAVVEARRFIETWNAAKSPTASIASKRIEAVSARWRPHHRGRRPRQNV